MLSTNSCPREHYSAWSSVKTLLKHELVTKWSNPAKFKVTDKVVRPELVLIL